MYNISNSIISPNEPIGLVIVLLCLIVIPLPIPQILKHHLGTVLLFAPCFWDYSLDSWLVDDEGAQADKIRAILDIVKLNSTMRSYMRIDSDQMCAFLEFSIFIFIFKLKKIRDFLVVLDIRGSVSSEMTLHVALDLSEASGFEVTVELQINTSERAYTTFR